MCWDERLTLILVHLTKDHIVQTDVFYSDSSCRNKTLLCEISAPSANAHRDIDMLRKNDTSFYCALITIVTVIATHLSMFVAHDIFHAIQIKCVRETSRGALLLLDKYKI